MQIESAKSGGRARHFAHAVRLLPALSAAMLSVYEEQRAENIRQNNARLQALGLEGQRPAPLPRPAAAKRRRLPEPDPGAIVRRSGRNAARVDYKEASVPGAATAAAAATTAAAASSSAEDASDDDDGDHPPALPFIDDRPVAEERSTRAVSVSLPGIIEVVGELVAGPCTKESVVALLSGGGPVRWKRLSWRCLSTDCVREERRQSGPVHSPQESLLLWHRTGRKRCHTLPAPGSRLRLAPGKSHR